MNRTRATLLLKFIACCGLVLSVAGPAQASSTQNLAFDTGIDFSDLIKRLKRDSTNLAIDAALTAKSANMTVTCRRSNETTALLNIKASNCKNCIVDGIFIFRDSRNHAIDFFTFGPLDTNAEGAAELNVRPHLQPPIEAIEVIARVISKGSSEEFAIDNCTVTRTSAIVTE